MYFRALEILCDRACGCSLSGDVSGFPRKHNKSAGRLSKKALQTGGETYFCQPFIKIPILLNTSSPLKSRSVSMPSSMVRSIGLQREQVQASQCGIIIQMARMTDGFCSTWLSHLKLLQLAGRRKRQPRALRTA